MAWTDWLATKHSLLIHVPVAVALLLPVALLAAQRAGRGIKPWWVTCRYLAWVGLACTLVLAISGHFLARKTGALAPGTFLASVALTEGQMLRQHQAAAAFSLVFSLFTLRSVYRRRLEHQGIGVLALFCGLVWSAATLFGAYQGLRMARDMRALKAKVHLPPPLPAPVPEVKADPDAEVLQRLMQYPSLLPMHKEPVRSAAHGNRWVRVWVSAGAEEAYRAGGPLPEGAQVVMSSVEDRRGQPGFEPGPLVGLDMKAGKAVLSYHGPLPGAQTGQVGVPRVTWHGEDANLSSCLKCHGEGLAPKADRASVQHRPIRVRPRLRPDPLQSLSTGE